jgi:hypothetical protein
LALVKSTFLEKLGGVVVVLFPEEPVVSIVVVMVSKSTLPLNIDCVYYLIENGQQIRDRRNKKISNRRDNFEYCIFLINTNFHDETFSDATF